MAGYDNTQLSLIVEDIGNKGGAVWRYTTAADADATITGAGYFADGGKRGMKVADLVDVIATTGPKFKRYQVSAVNVATGAVTVTAPTAIT